MTDPTLAAIEGLRSDIGALRTETSGSIQALRTDLSGRLDQAITRNEHSAEVRRIDAEAARTRDALTDHERQADLRLQAIQASVDHGDSEIRALIEAGEERREQAQVAAAERRRSDRRWFATWSVAAIGVAVAITQLIAALLR